MIRISRILPLILALVLQAAPMIRSLVPVLNALAAPAGIILKWAVAAAALQGATHAVSGASTVISSPAAAKGTNGVVFRYSITLSGDAANKWTWTPLPGSTLVPGLTLNTLGQIRGVPTQAGTNFTRITAMEVMNGVVVIDPGTKKPRQVEKDLTITIVDNPAGTPPVFTADLVAASVTAGQPHSFNVTVSGSPTPTLQWFLNNIALPGKTGSTLSFAAVSKADQGTYFVRATNSQGTKDSKSVKLVVNVPPDFSQQPVAATVTDGAPASFTAVVTGDPVPALQWFRGVDPVPGQTTPTLAFAPAQLSDAGEYFLRATNIAGTNDSATVRLTVKQVVAPFQISGPAQALGKVQFSFPGLVGIEYLVEFKDSLNDAAWKPLTNLSVLRGNGPLTVTDPVANPERWYRVGTK